MKHQKGESIPHELWTLLQEFNESNPDNELEELPSSKASHHRSGKKASKKKKTSQQKTFSFPRGSGRNQRGTVTRQALLNQIRNFSSWNNPEGEKGLQISKETFANRFPAELSRVQEYIDLGKKDAQLLKDARKLGLENIAEDKLRELFLKIPGDDKTYIKEMERRLIKQYSIAQSTFGRIQEARMRKKRGEKASSVSMKTSIPITQTKAPKVPLVSRPKHDSKKLGTLHPNDIRNQTPTSHWQLVIDEGGSMFNEQAIKSNKKTLGRFVGLLVPKQEAALPPLRPGWHAVSESLEEIDKAIQAILDAPVGVLGIDVNSLPTVPGERWCDGVALLIDWVIRLMPIEGRTHLEVLIEQRGSFIARQSWELVTRECIRRLALVYPAKAAEIALDIKVIHKNQTPFNGYVDAVAYTWARTTPESQARLKQSGLSGSCLLNSTAGFDSKSMLHAWDAFQQGVQLPTHTWWELFESKDLQTESSLLSILLKNVGYEATKSVNLWSSFLSETRRRMSEGPVDLQKFASAIDWLKQYKPHGTAIPPKMRLVWLTVMLARANHLGDTEQSWMTDLSALADNLFKECAPLVCHADLHLAVNATNRFDFDSAETAITRWASQPPEVPGLKYWAQVKSTQGQLAAFRGDNTRAESYFREAIEAFSRLSDPVERRKNELQTECYLAIALMDRGPAICMEVRNAVEKITGALPAAASELALSDNPADRYAHHLLLRWTAASGDGLVRDEYLKHQTRWFSGEGHPWPLIKLYRGILLKEASKAEDAIQQAVDAAQLAFSAEQGPTVRYIGCVCMAVAVNWGAIWSEKDVMLETLRKELPLVADRIDRLEREMSPGSEVTGMIRALLPFNFR